MVSELTIGHTVCALVGPDPGSSTDHERVAATVGSLYLGPVTSLLRSPEVWEMVSGVRPGRSAAQGGDAG